MPGALLRRVRNIGIMAHVDAGKTTVTERFLHYAGLTRHIGSVDDGNTVMDWMPQERERGITINSAAISFAWGDTHVNLIDTPGHVDFTFEVERALRVLDGAVVVLDAVEGVQSQTETVWRQANRFGVPRFAFVNKMDRAGASLDTVGATLRKRLGVEPLFAQLPVGLGDAGDTPDERFRGVVDLPSMTCHTWSDDGDGTGADFTAQPTEVWGAEDPDLLERAEAAREALVERAADFDDALAELYLGADAAADVGADDLWAALHRITVQRSGGGAASSPTGPEAIVALCGAAQQNRAVQPLMDAIPHLLPAPTGSGSSASGVDADADADADASVAVACAGTDPRDRSSVVERRGTPDEPLAALAFKVQNDPQRGDVVFVRVYSGTLHAKDKLLNTSIGTGVGTKERVNRLLTISADSVEEMDSIGAGHIGAVVGLKETRSGDTLCRQGERSPLVLEGLEVPPAVFTASVQMGAGNKAGKGSKDDLHEALRILAREDPSLQVVYEDPESKQTLVSGMGELHLHIVLDRIQRQFKLPGAELGKMRVAFRETLAAGVGGGGGGGGSSNGASVGRAEEDRMVGTKRRFAEITLRVMALAGPTGADGEVVMRNEVDLGAVSDPAVGGGGADGEEDAGGDGGRDGSGGTLKPAQLDAIREGIESVLAGAGPVAGYPVVGVRVELDAGASAFDEDSVPAACAACAARATRRALANAEMVLLEPHMNLLVSAPPHFVGSVVADVSSSTRRGVVVDVGGADDDEEAGGEEEGGRGGTAMMSTTIKAEVPLREMVGYSTDLRSMTKGEAAFTMGLKGYAPVLSGKIVEEVAEERKEILEAEAVR